MHSVQEQAFLCADALPHLMARRGAGSRSVLECQDAQYPPCNRWVSEANVTAGAYLGLVLGSVNDDSSQLLLVVRLSSLQRQEQMSHVPPQGCHLPLHQRTSIGLHSGLKEL